MARGGTIILGGPSGIGKSAIASSLCQSWTNGPAIWIDCQAITSFQEALVVVDSFARSELEDSSIYQASRAPTISASVAGKALGYLLDRHNALIVWDGHESKLALSDLIEATHSSLGKGVQVITERLHSENWLLPGALLKKITPLPFHETNKMLMELTSRRPSSELVKLTRGHPYLIQIAASSLRTIGIDEVAALLKDRSRSWIESSVLASLTLEERAFLDRCAIFRVGFDSDWVVESSSDLGLLSQLAAKFLVLKTREDRYVVHDLIRDLCLDDLDDKTCQELHKQAVALLWSPARRSLLALRELGHHALNAGTIREAQLALTSFVRLVARQGNWAMVLSATEDVPQLTPAPGWQTVHYYRARGLRLIGDLPGALESYRAAQFGEQISISLGARYEEASILALIGDDAPARDIYESLLDCEDSSFRAQARTALALMTSDDEFDKAVEYLEEAKSIASTNDLVRCEAEAEQTWGIVLLKHSQPQQAAEHLETAYQIRFELAQKERENTTLDLIGWHGLYKSLVEAETLLGRRERAYGAAHGLWEYSVLSGNLHWLADATFEFCTAATEGDEEALVACRLLRERIQESTSEAPIVSMMGYLVASLWSVGETEDALETALRYYREIGWGEVPLLFYKPPPSSNEETESSWFRALPEPHLSGWMLILPPSMSIEDFAGEIRALVDEYPEAESILMKLEGLASEDGF